MSIFRALLDQAEPVRAAPVGTDVYPGYVGPLGPTGAPSPITELTALRYPPVYAAVRTLAESGGMLPLLTYKRKPDGSRDRVQDSDDPRARMLRLQPNPLMTAMELWEAEIGVLNLLGNGYIYKRRDAYGRVKELWPLPPQVTQTMRDEDGTLWYYVVPGPTWAPGQLEPSLYHENDVIHLRGFGLDGYYGLSAVTLHRRAISIGSSADDMAESFYTNGGTPGGVLRTEQQLSDASFKRLKAQWDETHVGVGNAHKVAILEGGVQWQSVTLPNADAQFLETRQHQVTEIARIFRVPPHMIGDLSRATFSNIEQQSIDFVTYSLQPWLTRIEQRITSEVFDSSLDDGLFCEFLVDGLLRGDTLSRFQAYAQAPWMTDNEKRRKENLPPLDGLDEPTRPLNVATVATAQQDIEQRVQIAVAAIKAGADPAVALEVLGLTELTTEPEKLALPAAPPPTEEPTP